MARPTKESLALRYGNMIEEYQSAMKQIEKGRGCVLLDDYHRKIVSKYRNRTANNQKGTGEDRKECQ